MLHVSRLQITPTIVFLLNFRSEDLGPLITLVVVHWLIEAIVGSAYQDTKGNKDSDRQTNGGVERLRAAIQQLVPGEPVSIGTWIEEINSLELYLCRAVQQMRYSNAITLRILVDGSGSTKGLKEAASI